MATKTLSTVTGLQNPTVEGMRGKYFAIERGFVRDRNDPKKLGRVRCYVPAINPLDSKQGWLDWCDALSPGLAVPPVGEPVGIFFEQGQVDCPFYVWGWNKGDTGAKSNIPGPGVGLEDAMRVPATSASAGGIGIDFGASAPEDSNTSEYPYNKIFVSESGHVLELDDSPDKERIRVRHKAGTTVLIDPDGSLHVRTKGAQHYESEGDINFVLKAGATFKVVYPGGSSIAIGASGIVINGHQVNIMNRPVLPKPDGI